MKLKSLPNELGSMPSNRVSRAHHKKVSSFFEIIPSHLRNVNLSHD
jgi:hypothetical protein